LLRYTLAALDPITRPDGCTKLYSISRRDNEPLPWRLHWIYTKLTFLIYKNLTVIFDLLFINTEDLTILCRFIYQVSCSVLEWINQFVPT